MLATLAAALLASAAPQTSPAETAPAPEAAHDWSALAVADVEAAYAETKANHPGMFDSVNPAFPQLLETARSEALALARRASTPGGFAASLARFTAVLNDGHAGAYDVLPDRHEPPVRWPGFVAAWRGDAMYVHRAREGGPPAGSRIESCDGRPVTDLVRTNVFDWRSGVGVPGDWWSSARRVFVDDGNPFVALPQTCRFVKGRAAQDRALAWSPLPGDYQQWRNAAINGDLLPIGLAERAQGINWIAMPDFSPDEAGVAAYQTLFADIEAKAGALRRGRAVVLDLRHNNGGSSLWSRRIAELLWGKPAVEAARREASAKTRVLWRPTPGNLAEVRRFGDLIRAQGDAATAAIVDAFVPMFEAAVARGDTWLEEPDAPELPGQSTGDAVPLLTVPVYVVVPGQCASACLDAIDVFKLFPSTRLIGAPSSADSTYMEVRSPELPSGMARAIIPMKVYVDRPRGNGVFYEPDIVMRDFDWSTGNFLKRIEEDLAQR